MQINLQPLCAGPVGVAVRVEAGHGVYKWHEVVPCDASMYILQKAEGLLWPEKAQFHKVGSILGNFRDTLILLSAFFFETLCHSAARHSPNALAA